ncbi:hypothetical protein [Aggregicoccus sp. 17bor-14]|uniref:hypothetical protein n=1 Tax=Myxococcaceae TaxID=31 RepID=UPI00351A265D
MSVGDLDAPVALAAAETDEAPAGGLALPAAPAQPAQRELPTEPSGALVAPEEPVTAPSEGRERASEPVRKEPKVRVSGRVYAGGSADERKDYKRKLGVSEARVGVEARYRNVEAEVSADLSSKAILKDAYVRLADDAKRLRLYAGQFKAPFLARELESSWSLPLINRGLVQKYLVDDHQLGGRRMGLMGEVKAQGAWALRASAGVFRGALDEFGTPASEDVSGRIAVQPFSALTLGASTYLTEAFKGVRNYAGAADASLELGALRLSAEGSAGHLPVGRFLAQTALASYTLPVGTGPWALQPLVGAELMQLRSEAQRAQGHAVLGGVNVLYAEVFKAQLQAERALRPGDEAPGLELSVQLATRF